MPAYISTFYTQVYSLSRLFLYNKHKSEQLKDSGLSFPPTLAREKRDWNHWQVLGLMQILGPESALTQ